jgi:hypothetical protein
MYFVGLDLGQKRDFSAVAVVEREEYGCLRVRHLERMALGTPYTRVVSRVGEILRHPALAARSRLVVDATGVGVPVVELLRGARLPCAVTAVTITSGERAHGRGEEWHVPKRDLLTGLQVLLEEKRLKVNRKLRGSDALVREMADVRLHPRAGGHVRMGAEGQGEHDDLVLAVALACWQARRREIGFGTQRIPGI